MMSGNTVGNIIVADDKEDAERALGTKLVEFSETDSVNVGYILNDDGTFSPPEIPSVE